MTNKEKVIERLKNISAELQKEIDYYLNDVDHEEIPDYDIVDALDDVANLRMEHYIKIEREIFQIYIDTGYAIVRDPNTQTFGGRGKKYWFKMKGIEYDPVCGWEDWIKK